MLVSSWYSNKKHIQYLLWIIFSIKTHFDKKDTENFCIKIWICHWIVLCPQFII